jgi:hypothetical protein
MVGTVGSDTTAKSTSTGNFILVYNAATGALSAGNTSVNTQIGGGLLRSTTGVFPFTDNTGEVGNSTFTWNNGNFTSLTVDSTLNVRAALDLADNDVLRIGSGDDFQFIHDGTTNFISCLVGDMVIRNTASTGNLFSFSRTTGNFTAVGTITANFSDDNLKTVVGYIKEPLSKIKKLTGFYYTPNEIAIGLGYENKIDVGVSAQQVQKILPEIVYPAPISNNYLTIQYEKLTPLIIEAIKELEVRVSVIESKLNND